MHHCRACNRTVASGAKFHKDRSTRSGLRTKCKDCLNEQRLARRAARTPEKLAEDRARNAARMRAWRKTPEGKAAEAKNRDRECYRRYQTSEKAKRAAQRRRKRHAAEGKTSEWQARYRARKKMRSNTGWEDEEPEFTENEQQAILDLIAEEKRKRAK